VCLAEFGTARLGKLSPVILVSLLILGGALSARADVITVDTSRLIGASAQLAFDFIGGPDANMITVSIFSTNGSLGAISRTGEVSGTLPGTVTLTDASPADFFNEYLTNITLGTTFSFVLGATTIGPPGGSFPDAFSLFVLDPTTGLSLVTTTDPTGSQSLLTLNIDGSPQGNLNVYSSNSVVVTATPVSTVPEPSTVPLLASLLALVALAGRARVFRLLADGRIKS
jgi:hypothetical protein